MTWMQAGAFTAAGLYMLLFRPLGRPVALLGASLACSGIGTVWLMTPGTKLPYHVLEGVASLLIVAFIAIFPRPARVRPILAFLVAVAAVYFAAALAFVLWESAVGPVNRTHGLLYPSGTGGAIVASVMVLTWLQGFGRQTESQKAAGWVGLAVLAVPVSGGGFELVRQLTLFAREGSFLTGRPWIDQSFWWFVWVVIPVALAVLQWSLRRWRAPAVLFLLGCVSALPVVFGPTLDADTRHLLRVWGYILKPAFILYAQARFACFAGAPIGLGPTTAVTGLSALFAYGYASIAAVALTDGIVAFIVAPVAGLAAAVAIAALVLPAARRYDLRRMLEAGTARGLAPGVTVLGRYRIEAELAQGGQARVYEATDLRRGRGRVALKVVPAGTDDEEVDALRSLDHPNIVRLHDVVRIPGSTVLVLDYAAGGTLRGWLDRAPGAGRRDAANLLVAGVVAGLAAAHAAGVAHRDLKPENVLLHDAVPRLADFGLARRSHAARTLGKDVAGTVAYLAPEQVRGEPGDARSDVWAAAVLIHELYTGQRPFAPHEDDFLMRQAILRDEPRILVRDRRLARVLRAALAKDPADRCPDAGQLWRLLQGS